MEMGSGSLGASAPNDSLDGLQFGKKIYFEVVGGGGSSSKGTLPAPPPPVPAAQAASKKGRGVVQGGQQQPPRCQVEGCRLDLTGAKAYYCRHKVCGMHSKSPKVIVAGLEQRFCQQCSRFHQLPEFDQGKRSCRRRLAGHNERRRKPPPGSLSSRYGRLPSSFHEDSGRFGGFLMDFSYPRLSGTARDVWPTVRVGDPLSGSQWQQAGLDAPPSGGVVAPVTHPYVQGPTGGTFFPSQEIPPGKGLGVSENSCALSLLSTQPWGNNTTTAAPRNHQDPSISMNPYEGPPMAQPTIATSFASSSWGFKGHESSSSSHEIPREMGLEPRAAEQFSGELELALQGNRQCMDPGHGRAYGPSGHLMHWSL